MSKKKFTEAYINGKRVRVKSCKRVIKGFNSIQRQLKQMTFFKGSVASQEVKLNTGDTLKIVVKDLRK